MAMENHGTIASGRESAPKLNPILVDAAEGGCGVIGAASSLPLEGRHLLPPLLQMHNRGNGKGGGIAAVGLSAEQLAISDRTLRDSYLMQVAYLDPSIRGTVEADYIDRHFSVLLAEKIPTIQDHRSIGLEVRPPDVWRYLVRADEDELRGFVASNDLEGFGATEVEDEYVYRNSYSLNRKYYASLGEKRAFVLSCGRNMMVLKIVGHAEQVLRYYRLEDLKAHIWVGHQRYPTKGKVWHPGGAHPFAGLNDALVHNGDFANYQSICDYLKQRDTHPLFLTDTEVAALYWDLLTRVYRYPLEYAIEAIAPTTERDFTMLSPEKREIYKAIQTAHIHGSPDGPWFFIIARNNTRSGQFQLIGITDTSMLRPQVFALQGGNTSIGLIASEKQAIDAMLKDLAEEGGGFHPMADRYWYARGGSYTDGGAFIFTIDESHNLTCTDKFGTLIPVQGQGGGREGVTRSNPRPSLDIGMLEGMKPLEIYEYVAENVRDWDLAEVHSFVESIDEHADRGDGGRSVAIEALTLLIDRRYDIGDKRRSEIIPLFEERLFDILGSIPLMGSDPNGSYSLIDWQSRHRLMGPINPDQTLVIDAGEFRSEGEGGTCQFLERAHGLGWRKFIAYNFRGQRNFGAGLVSRDKVRIDIYGRVGDCLAAFADGPEFYVHGSAQDSVAYCLRSGKLVIYGDAGKAFEYGAKGGVTYIQGDLIDRPLINAVGSAIAVINGSCKDYMGESFMAAAGFTILNGLEFDEHGRAAEQGTPYHGGNLFPLASAGAVYMRDPLHTVGEDQLNGSKLINISHEDWLKILPFLEENERLFGINVEGLLTVEGRKRGPEEVYRKVVPIEVAALTRYERGD
jgi:glutamate synthase domain-containing protein 1